MGKAEYAACFAEATEEVAQACFQVSTILRKQVLQYGSCVIYGNLKMSVWDDTLSRRGDGLLLRW